MDTTMIKARANLLRQIELVVDSELPYVDTKDRAYLIWKLADSVTDAFPINN